MHDRLGDPYFPLLGNGGYDVRHYDLSFSYEPATDRLDGTMVIQARATQDLSRFDLDLQQLDVSAVRVNDAPAAFSRDGQELQVTPSNRLRAGSTLNTAVDYGGIPQTIIGSPIVFGSPYGFLHTDDLSAHRSRRPSRSKMSRRPGLPEFRTHDYVRHGTTTLFAALEVATGKVVDACYDRHRHQEFLRFLRQVAKAYPRQKLHVVVDNYATHKHPTVQAWLARNKRVTLHFTPTSGSWLNLVEVFFSIITRQAIHRGSFASVPDLIAAIRRFIDGWNDRCQPFT